VIKIKVKPNEPFEKVIRRFRKKVETEGIMREIKKRKFYMTKSEKRREKRKLAEKRRKKTENRNSK